MKIILYSTVLGQQNVIQDIQIYKSFIRNCPENLTYCQNNDFMIKKLAI